jgi:hypothetical protein
MKYKVAKVYDLFDKEFEQLLNRMDREGFEIYSLIPQMSGTSWETYCYAVIFSRKKSIEEYSG